MIDQSLLNSLKTLHKTRTGVDFWSYTYPEWAQSQLDFISSPAKKLLVEASRRSGKSVALAERMLKKVNTPVEINGVLHYGSYVYIAPTKSDAKSIIWNQLKEMCRMRGLTYASHEVDLKMTFPNGGFIQLEGAGLASSAEKARGKKNLGIAIDEAAFINALGELVGIWGKTLYDLGGEFILSSSPGKSKSGFFYKCSHGDNSEFWDRYYLKGSENPIFKNGRYQELIAEDLRTMYGGNINHPEYVRECLGQWVEDSSSRLIKYDESRNLYDDLHEKNTDLFDYIIGLDIGFLDSTALSVVAVAKYEPLAIFVDEFTKPEMRISEIVETIEQYAKKWDAVSIVVDSGGMGHHTFVELQNREGLPAVDRAQKYGKKLNIELLNNELYAGRIKVLPSCTQTIRAWKIVLKNEKGVEDDNVDYGSQGVLDILDASLYASMECHPAIFEQLKPQETEEERMKRARFEREDKKNKVLNEFGMKGFI
jgi:hypothetical protein